MLGDFLLGRQKQSVETQLVMGVVSEAVTDGEGHFTGEYVVVDQSSGITYRCWAVRFGNMKYIYTKGDQVLVAMGVSPTNNTTSCFILGQIAKEYPNEAKPPSDYALDEGETGIKNPISSAGVYFYSDGMAEVRGRVGGSISIISLLLGGVKNLFQIGLNVKNFLVRITPDKVMDIALKSINAVLEMKMRIQARFVEFVLEILKVVTHKSIILVSDRDFVVVADDIEIHGDSRISVKGTDIEMTMDDLVKLIAERVVFRIENEIDFNAAEIRLNGSSYKVVRGELLINWLRNHKHPVSDGFTGPPIPTPTDTILSNKVKVG